MFEKFLKAMPAWPGSGEVEYLEVIHTECVKIPPWAQLTVGASLRAARTRVNMVGKIIAYMHFFFLYYTEVQILQVGGKSSIK